MVVCPITYCTNDSLAQSLSSEVWMRKYTYIQEAGALVPACSGDEFPFVKTAEGDLMRDFHVGFIHIFW